MGFGVFLICGTGHRSQSTRISINKQKIFSASFLMPENSSPVQLWRARKTWTLGNYILILSLVPLGNDRRMEPPVFKNIRNHLGPKDAMGQDETATYIRENN